ncbi:MAG: hypothetical protein BMS9Abin11_1746 [Gammaproteobacteria bacterium]|nr:MAG: hypothetical protein BMS9Abin11_1746 [Gammaproteobacteria bacterium]
MKAILHLLVMTGLVILVGYAQAAHINIAWPAPQLHLGVGTLGATVDTVSFVVPSGSEGSGVPVVGSAPVLIEVATRRAGFGTIAYLVVDSFNPLTNGPYTIPMTEISWTSVGQIGAGTYNGTTNQLLLLFWAGNGTRRREATHTFSYANTTVPVGGTYSGTVTYTAGVL